MEAHLVFIWPKHIQSATVLTLYTSKGGFVLQKSCCCIAKGACGIITIVEEFCIKTFRSEMAFPPKKNNKKPTKIKIKICEQMLTKMSTGDWNRSPKHPEQVSPGAELQPVFDSQRSALSHRLTPLPGNSPSPGAGTPSTAPQRASHLVNAGWRGDDVLGLALDTSHHPPARFLAGEGCKDVWSPRAPAPALASSGRTGRDAPPLDPGGG